MTSYQPLCQLYRRGDTFYGNALGHYLAAVRDQPLPQPQRTDDHVVDRGYAVGVGSWFFFTDLTPAVVFGRAARMSFNCPGYGVYEAAIDRRWCPFHRDDEAVLVLGHEADVRGDYEAEVIHHERFLRAVQQHPDTAHWREPSGRPRPQGDPTT